MDRSTATTVSLSVAAGAALALAWTALKAPKPAAPAALSVKTPSAELERLRAENVGDACAVIVPYPLSRLRPF